MGFSGILSSNLATKFRNSKWRPQNWPIFKKIRRFLKIKYKITLYKLHGVFGDPKSEFGSQILKFKMSVSKLASFFKYRAKYLRLNVKLLYISYMGFSSMLSPNLATKFRKSKWRPQNWPVFEKIRRRFNSKYKITLYKLHGVFGAPETEFGN